MSRNTSTVNLHELRERERELFIQRDSSGGVLPRSLDPSPTVESPSSGLQERERERESYLFKRATRCALPLAPLLALSCPQPSTALRRCFPGASGSFSVLFPLRFCRPHFPLAVCHRRLFLVRGLVAQSAGDSRFRVGFIHLASAKITPACAVMHLASPKSCWHQLMSAARSGSGANRRQHA